MNKDDPLPNSPSKISIAEFLKPASAVTIFILSWLFNKFTGDMFSKYGWLAATMSLTLACALVFITFYLVNSRLIGSRNDILKNFHESLISLNKSFSSELMSSVKTYLASCERTNGIDWLSDSGELAAYEKSLSVAECPEIWLITSDLSEDIPGSIYAAAVEENLKKGIVYRYFVPEEHHLIASRITSIKALHKVGCDCLRFYFMGRDKLPDLISLVNAIDFILYNPRDKEKVSYMGIAPYGMNPNGGRINIRISEELSSVLITLIETNVPDLPK